MKNEKKDENEPMTTTTTTRKVKIKNVTFCLNKNAQWNKFMWPIVNYI